MLLVDLLQLYHVFLLRALYIFSPVASLQTVNAISLFLLAEDCIHP